eukprot:tig00021127_g18864.t1
MARGRSALLLLVLVALLAAALPLKALAQRQKAAGGIEGIPLQYNAASADDSDDGDEADTGAKQAAAEDDEFVGIPAGHHQAQQQQAQQTPIPRPKKQGGFRLRKQENYHYELGALAIVVLFALNYLVGRRANEAIAKAWTTHFFDLYEKNFSSPAAGDRIFQKESQWEFKMYSTGRTSCQYAITQLTLKKRHDLFMMLANLVQPTKDTMTVTVAMNDDEMDPFVFAAVRKRLEKTFKKDRKDISSLAPPVPSQLLPEQCEGLSVLSDCPEITGELLPTEVLRVLSKKPSYFRSLHFSDQDEGREKKTLKFEFELPPAGQMSELLTLMRMVFYYVDRVPSVSLPAPAKARAEKARKELVAAELKKGHKEREEAAQRKKQERKEREEAERERLAATLSRDELRRLEAKQAKADLKKRMPKVKISKGG